MITKETRIELKVPYNTTYNVSILTTPQCGQRNIMVPFIELCYGEYKIIMPSYRSTLVFKI